MDVETTSCASWGSKEYPIHEVTRIECQAVTDVSFGGHIKYKNYVIFTLNLMVIFNCIGISWYFNSNIILIDYLQCNKLFLRQFGDFINDKLCCDEHMMRGHIIKEFFKLA